MGKVELFEAPYGRLLVALGAFPLVPAAITGTDRLWLGPLPRPLRGLLPRRGAVAAAPSLRRRRGRPVAHRA